MRVYKLITKFKEDGRTVRGSQYPDLPFSIEYPIGEIVRHISGTPLLAYSELPFYTGTSFGSEMWEAETVGHVEKVEWVIDPASLQNLTYEQLIEQWHEIRTKGEPNKTIKMRAPRNTVSVQGLRLVRRVPSFPPSIPELLDKSEGM